MTREKAIEMLKYIRYAGNGESEYKNCAQSVAIDMAIKALEQEPKVGRWIPVSERGLMCGVIRIWDRWSGTMMNMLKHGTAEII